ncbi:glycoside hydrolase family protein [Pectobacterium versatile]|uniref:hypothetical protein n=1 Tax=Pectobacterium versatile TaxID=2488639 RepID=UPI001F1FD12C|nr:hypothetical protein [Pectobacterium versatile]
MSIIWGERKFIFNVSDHSDYAFSHAHKPTPLIINDDVLRIFFGARGKDGKTRTTYIDVNIDSPDQVINAAMPIVLDLGKIGAFDDCGANVCSIIQHDNKVYMYYIGWNPSTTVHTRNAIGIAVSLDGGDSFQRLYDGPILDRDKNEPYYTGAVDVIHNGDFFEMWYTSGVRWEMVNNKPEIIYHIKYARSTNGIDWTKTGDFCISSVTDGEVTARPSVIYENNKYCMWFSHRKINGFRDQRASMYRAGYAESNDGVLWVRNDANAGILPSYKESEWDSDAVAYPYVRKIKNKYIMLYNGNGFGKTGIGYMLSD